MMTRKPSSCDRPFSVCVEIDAAQKAGLLEESLQGEGFYAKFTVADGVICEIKQPGGAVTAQKPLDEAIAINALDEIFENGQMWGYTPK